MRLKGERDQACRDLEGGILQAEEDWEAVQV